MKTTVIDQAADFGIIFLESFLFQRKPGFQECKEIVKFQKDPKDCKKDKRQRPNDYWNKL